jgi:hypothetical protein
MKVSWKLKTDKTIDFHDKKNKLQNETSDMSFTK